MAAALTEEQFLAAPALEPPPGEYRNTENPGNLRVELYSVVFSCLSLATLLICVHAYTSFRVLKRVNYDDYLLYFSWCLLVTFAGITCWAGVPPTGVHQWNLTIGDLQIVLYRVNLAIILFGLTILPLKIAVMVKCLRVFVPRGKRNLMWWASQILLWSHGIFYVFYVLFFIVGCIPRSAVWNIWVLTTQNARCVNFNALIWTSGIYNLVSDLALFILPQTVIWRLQMPTKRKKGLSFLFFLGALACVASACRLYYIVLYNTTGDQSYYIAMQAIVAFPELTASFLIGCLPIIPKFFAVVLKYPLFHAAARRSGNFRTICETNAPKPRRWPLHLARATTDISWTEEPNVIHITTTYQVLFEEEPAIALDSDMGASTRTDRIRSPDHSGNESRNQLVVKRPEEAHTHSNKQRSLSSNIETFPRPEKEPTFRTR